MATEGRVLVHFDSERVSVYRSQGGELKLLKRERLAFEDSLADEVLADRVGEFCAGLKEFNEVVDNKTTRLYATGVVATGQPEWDLVTVEVHCRRFGHGELHHLQICRHLRLERHELARLRDAGCDP
ncbi:hypothetical protein OG520_40300 (plasmid) [Streptomyces sp. NBC_00984]|uniref:hypothetical protein n=1 Tax=Streptomyces sp. NBC_00984 TaxID=2903700 RepID=UPI002F90EBBD|nr:hypothetical protein OG520_40300 [Streptomyces sp. NBC_00984]